MNEMFEIYPKQKVYVVIEIKNLCLCPDTLKSSINLGKDNLSIVGTFENLIDAEFELSRGSGRYIFPSEYHKTSVSMKSDMIDKPIFFSNNQKPQFTTENVKPNLGAMPGFIKSPLSEQFSKNQENFNKFLFLNIHDNNSNIKMDTT